MLLVSRPYVSSKWPRFSKSKALTSHASPKFYRWWRKHSWLDDVGLWRIYWCNNQSNHQCANSLSQRGCLCDRPMARCVSSGRIIHSYMLRSVLVILGLSGIPVVRLPNRLISGNVLTITVDQEVLYLWKHCLPSHSPFSVTPCWRYSVRVNNNEENSSMLEIQRIRASETLQGRKATASKRRVIKWPPLFQV